MPNNHLAFFAIAIMIVGSAAYLIVYIGKLHKKGNKKLERYVAGLSLIVIVLYISMIVDLVHCYCLGSNR